MNTSIRHKANEVYARLLKEKTGADCNVYALNSHNLKVRFDGFDFTLKRNQEIILTPLKEIAEIVLGHMNYIRKTAVQLCIDNMGKQFPIPGNEMAEIKQVNEDYYTCTLEISGKEEVKHMEIVLDWLGK
jgi:uncharacterized protein YaiE (UPF0345 family)